MTDKPMNDESKQPRPDLAKLALSAQELLYDCAMDLMNGARIGNLNNANPAPEKARDKLKDLASDVVAVPAALFFRNPYKLTSPVPFTMRSDKEPFGEAFRRPAALPEEPKMEIAGVQGSDIRAAGRSMWGLQRLGSAGEDSTRAGFSKHHLPKLDLTDKMKPLYLDRKGEAGSGILQRYEQSAEPGVSRELQQLFDEDLRRYSKER